MSETYKHIEHYFNQIRKVISDYSGIIASSEVNYETRTRDEGTISGSIKFIDQSELYIREYLFIKQSELIRSTYRFHWQDNEKEMLIRWDNAPHFPKSRNFPHHKHTPEHDVETEPVNLPEVLKIIMERLISR